MKRDLHKLVALLAILFLPFALFAQYVDPAYGIRIDESFEKGIPADWTQENVKGSVNWVAESQDLTFPTGATDSLARAAFRNTSGVTNKAVTRLVLPPVEVASLFQPVLIFSHAQDKWSGDFDSLRVLCRTSADGEWKTLTAYDNYIAKWQRDTIFLPAAAYCQIAFEAADNLGRGVVIDDVVIRSTPSCFDPEALYTSNVTNNSITVNWQGSFDAEYFYVKLSRDTLTPAQLESPTTELVCDTTTDGVSMDFDGLIQGTRYYCYVRSQCEHEISGWVLHEFKTANIANIPDTITFNLPEDPSKPKQPAYMDGWYYAAASPEYKPCVNSNGADWKWGASYDGTPSLVFSYSVSSGVPVPNCYQGALPADVWAYAATPEFTVDIKDLQISFETFCYYRYVADQFGITVGVMTDPEDRSTFVPVKTIINERQFIYEDYTVTFENYTGDGKYIAFMSDFDKSNHFTIENLIIEPRKEITTFQYDIMMPTASTLQFKCEQVYDSYDVVLTSTEYAIDRNADFPDTLDYVSKHSIQNMGTIENLTPDARYFVYVRGVKGDKKGRWLYPRYVEMPSRLDYNTLPYVMDFEGMPTATSIDMNGYSTSSSVSLPRVIKPLFTYFSNTFKMSDSSEWVGTSYRIAEPLSKTDFRIGCYWPYHAVTIAVFPELDMSKTKVSFYAAGRMGSKTYDPTSASNLKNYKSKAAVGVMADANDINSFIAIDTIEPSFTDYTYYEYDFSLYPEAKGNFFAIKVEEFEYTHTSITSYTNNVHVDNVTFAKSLDCKSPSDMAAEVDENDPSKATITWSANGVTEWNLKVATTEYDKAQFGTSSDFEFVFDGKVTEPKAVLTGLKYPNQIYYYWLQPVCDGVGAEWTMTRSFETFCPAVHTVPYTQTFDNVTAVGSNVWDGFAAECMYTKQWSRTISGLPSSYKNKYYYPYVTNTRAYNGNNSLPFFKKYSSTSRNYVALPLLDKPIDSLQITFRLYSLKNSISYWKAQELAVGVMTDPMDINTFEQVALVKPSKKETWERILVKFNEYKGQGKYIAIRETDKYTQSPEKSTEYVKGTNTDSVYIDNIEVNVAAPCNAPFDIFASDVTPNSAKLNWKSDAQTAVVVVANKALDFAALLDYDDYKAGNLANFADAASIVFVDTVVGTKYVGVSGLTVNQEYYVYMKSFCNDMYTDYSDAYTFSTFCPLLPAENFIGNFTDGTKDQLPDCWFVGHTHGSFTGTNTIKNYVAIYDATNYYSAQGKCMKIISTNGSLNTSYNVNNPNGMYLTTPNLDIDTITKYKVRFKAWTSTSYMYTGCGSNDYARAVIVGVVTNPYDMSTFVPVDTIENIFRDPYPYEVHFDNYICDLNGDTGKFISFYSNFGIRNQIYLDDVEVLLDDNCPRFEGQVESKTTTSVTLKFKSVPASYEVKASPGSQVGDFAAFDSLTTFPSEIGTSNIITIDSLENHKEYFFYARSTVEGDCQDWKLVLVASAANNTERDLPFVDGFESNTVYGSYGACPHDWYGFYATGNVSYPTISSSSMRSGARSAYLYASGGNDVYLVSPKLNTDNLSDCYLEFDFYISSTSSYPTMRRSLTVGVVSDPNNIVATFEPLDTIILEPAELGNWHTAKYELKSYTGAAKHIAFRSDLAHNKELFSTFPYVYTYIDNVTVDYVPGCYNPISFKSETVTDKSIELSFTHEGALKYEAVYATSGSFNDPNTDTLPSYVKIKSFTGTQFKIDSLYAEMPYDVYVRAICTEKDTSNWVKAGKYTTLPSLISEFPYYNDFSDDIENANWKHKAGSTYGWFFGVDQDSLVADRKNSTDAALYFSFDQGKTAASTNKSGYGFVYRYIILDEGTYEISFDWVVPGQPRVTSSQALFEQNLCRVFLMESSVTLGTTQIKTQAGKSLSLSYIDPILKNVPEGVYDISNVTNWGKDYCAMFGSDLTLPLDQQWQRYKKTITVDKEMAGSYMLAFHFYSGSKADITADGYRAAVFDNLSIVKSECGYVSDITVVDKTDKSVTLSWNTSDSNLASYDVLLLNADVDPNTATDAQKAYSGTAASTSTVVNGLNQFTTYYVYVRPTCASENNLWGNPVEVTTNPNIPDGYTFSFEEEDMLYLPPFTDGYMYTMGGSTDKKYLNASYKRHKWLTWSMVEANNTAPTNYNFNNSYGPYYPHVACDTLMSSTQYYYGRTGKRALWFGSRTTAAFMNGATVALPYAGEFDGKRLIFYMRAIAGKKSTSSSTAKENVSHNYPYYASAMAPDNQSRKITVGTMTDPNDATTFVAIDTVQYPYGNKDYAASAYFETKDPSGDKGWHRVVLSLKDVKGKHIAFRYEHYGTATTDKNLNMFIDDVTIETIPECPAPELMTITKLRESSITVDYSYDGTPTTYVEVATDEEFTNVVVSNTFTSLPFTITGLQPLTKYYIRAKVICSDLDESEYSLTREFETPVGLCYDNSFDNEATHYPANWQHSFNPSIAGFTKATGTFSFNTPSSGNTWGWKVKPALFASGKFSSAKNFTAIPSSQTSSTSALWALSPVIELDENAEQHLSFDLSLTEKGNNNPVDFSLIQGDTTMTFMVSIIDVNKGYVYNREDATIWKPVGSLMSPEYVFTEIPHRGAEYSIDLTKYKGKNIQVLLCYFTTQNIDLHLDNFHVNKYATKEYDASTCEFCDFEDNDFFILSSNTQLGENRFSKWELNEEAPDTMLILNLNVADAPETDVDATICAGDVYNDKGFTGLMTEGVYRQKFTSKNGCDSIVTLALNVVAPQTTTIVDTICWGTKYSFNGKEYDRTGIYVDTLVSVLTGCDSIVTLALSVADVIRTEQYVNICFGETYTFGSQTISATGKYEEMFKTVDGCDSLVTLHATMLPEYKKEINAVIKEGEEYSSEGFRGLTEEGEYELVLKSVDGCDSLVILNLKVLDNSTTEAFVNICFGDSYVFGSQTITTSGEYVETFKSVEGGDSVVMLTATVLPDYRQAIEATICAGEVYNENGFTNLSSTGVYTQDLKSVDGCDSTITLNLTVLSGDTTRVEFKITTDDLPYEYKGLYYDKSTRPGTYVDTIVVETENCEEVIIHTLVVDPGVSIDNVNSSDLVMVPNPVAVNGTLYINAEFTAEERDGMVVEVFNAIGQRVYVEYPSIYPIEVTGLSERGMYIVRIIAGNGKSYQGKIIVE